MNNPQAIKTAQGSLSQCTRKGLDSLKSFIRPNHPQEPGADKIEIPSTNKNILHIEVLREEEAPFGMEGIDGLGCSYRFIRVDAGDGSPEKKDLGSFSAEEISAAISGLAKTPKDSAMAELV
jgi:hypothetical protein